MQTYTSHIDMTAKVSKDDLDFAISNIPAWYDAWDRARDDTQTATFNALQDAIMTNISKPSPNGVYLLPQVYEQYHTLKANMLKTSFLSYNSLLTVNGRTPEDDANASAQKQLLQHTFEDMEFIGEADKLLHYFLLTGEIIAYVGWLEKTKLVMREPRMEDMMSDKPPLGTSDGKVIQQITEYDNPIVQAIDPLNVVYDRDRFYDWEACPLIYRTWVSIQDIVDNDMYDLLTDEDKEELLLSANPDGLAVNVSKTIYPKAARTGLSSGMYEVLEYWGDIYIDGVIHRNVVINIIAGQYCGRFSHNPYLEKPFAIYRFMPNPETGRGTSPLSPTVPINEISSAILSYQLEALKLTLKKPFLAPAGSFAPGKVFIEAGKVVTYNPSTTQGAQPPIPLDFKDAIVGFDFLTFFQAALESSTGGFKYMTGAQDNRARTAAETTISSSAANTRMASLMQVMNSCFLVTVFKKVAGLLADFKEGDQYVRSHTSDGKKTFIIVDEMTRTGRYSYTYGDALDKEETKGLIQQLTNMLAAVADRANVNWDEVLKFEFNKLNIPDADILIKPDPVNQAIAQLPPQIKDEVKQRLAQAIPALVQAMQQQGNAQAQGMGGMNSAAQNFNSQSNPVGRAANVPVPQGTQ